MTRTNDKTHFEEAQHQELLRLRDENLRLKALLTRHSILWKEPAQRADSSPQPTDRPPVTVPQLSPSEKIALFRRLFRGRSDVFPIRWESAKGRSGYSPACGNEWKAVICRKPAIKCGDCEHRLFLPLTDQVVFDHLAGHHTIGIYPLLPDETCFFLAVDFDEADQPQLARMWEKRQRGYRAMGYVIKS